MNTSNPVLNIYQIEFLLHRHIYLENRLIGKILDYQEMMGINQPIVNKNYLLREMLEPSNGLIFNDNNTHDFLTNICLQFRDLISIKFKFDFTNENIQNLVTNQGVVIYQWKIINAGVVLGEDWKPELFNKNLYDHTKKIQKSDSTFFKAISNMLTEQEKLELYYEKIIADNPTLYIEWN